MTYMQIFKLCNKINKNASVQKKALLTPGGLVKRLEALSRHVDSKVYGPGIGLANWDAKKLAISLTGMANRAKQMQALRKLNPKRIQRLIAKGDQAGLQEMVKYTKDIPTSLYSQYNTNAVLKDIISLYKAQRDVAKKALTNINPQDIL